MTISIRAAAAQLGISHTALRKRIQHGKVTWPPVSMEAMAEEWGLNKDALQQQRGAKSTGKPKAERPVEAKQRVPLEEPTLSISQAREAALRVEERKLKLALRKGEVLEAAKVNQYVGGMIIKAAEVLDRIPDELADRLAQQSDPVACRDLLRRELSRARFELAEYRA